MAGVSFLDGPPRLPSPFMGARNTPGLVPGAGHDEEGGATPAFFPSCPDLFRASTGCSMTPPVGGYSG